MQQVKAGETVLICYGDMHFYYQQPRMERAGWAKEELQNASKYFTCKSAEFQYPESMLQIVENCIDYYENGFMEEAYKNVTDLNALQLYKQMAAKGANTYEKYKKMVEEQRMYYTEADFTK